MAKLPSNTFMFNYNAKQYDSSTYTFPKAKGQLFDEDLVLNKAPNSFTDDSVYFGGTGAFMGRTNYTQTTDPFNRDSSNNTLTFIYKTSGWTSGETNIFANRNSNYNWMVRADKFHCSNTILNLTPNSNPQICVIRINADGSSIKRFVDSNGNTLQSTSASSITWGTKSQGFGFFAGYANGNEYFNQTFYWMYCSMEALTDEQILQVIQYNEGNLIQFGPDVDELSFKGNSGSTTIELTSESPWTATTSSDWITLSQYSGETGGNITIAVKQNTFNSRTGIVEFTDGENTATLTVNQAPDTSAPIMKMILNGRRLN